MTDKLDIKRLDSVTANDVTSTKLINDNFEAIQIAVEKTLFRDGTVPNYMDAELDMNSRKIINVAEPTEDRDVVTLKYVKEYAGDAKQWADEAEVNANRAVSSAQSAAISASSALSNAQAAGQYAEQAKAAAEDPNVIAVGEDLNSSFSNIKNVSNSIANVDIVSLSIANVNTVADSISNVNIVALNILDINTVVANITDIQNASENALLAKYWAEGDDDVIPEPGKHSSRVYANLSNAIANTPEDVPVDASTLLAVDVIRGPQGIPGPAGKDGKDGDNDNIIGEIISVLCTADYTPLGTLPCDGSEYSKDMYQGLWDNYLVSTPAKLPTCSYTEYAADLTTYGQCIRIAIDTTAGTFKVPTIKDGSYITQALSDSEIGKVYNESLPNILGTVPTSGNGNAALGMTGAFYNDGTTNSYGAGGNTAAAKVQGDNVRLRYFIVIAQGSLNDSMIDWNQWHNAMAFKANTDLINITDEAKNTLVLNMMPDYTATVGIDINVTGTAPSNGYISILGRAASNTLQTAVGLRISGFPVFAWGGQHQTAYNPNGCLFPISKGETYQTSSPSAGALESYWINFVPCKGAV